MSIQKNMNREHFKTGDYVVISDCGYETLRDYYEGVDLKTLIGKIGLCENGSNSKNEELYEVIWEDFDYPNDAKRIPSKIGTYTERFIRGEKSGSNIIMIRKNTMLLVLI